MHTNALCVCVCVCEGVVCRKRQQKETARNDFAAINW